jgi:hypothetical protein
MPEWTKPEYSRSLVRKAGNVLAGTIPPPKDDAEKAQIVRQGIGVRVRMKHTRAGTCFQ